MPVPWLARQPFNVELRTIHVDRTRLDKELMDAVLSSGVKVVHEKVTGVESEGRRVTAIQTESGQTMAAKWFVDASGLGASLFGRHFRLSAIESGPPKVAIWTYFTRGRIDRRDDVVHGAAGGRVPGLGLGDSGAARCGERGVRDHGAGMKARREKGESVEGIFRSQMEKFPRFAALLAERGR